MVCALRRAPGKDDGLDNFLNTAFYGAADYRAFVAALQQTINLTGGAGVFTGDNLFTFNKSLGFLQDEAFVRAFDANTDGVAEKSVIWRTHVLVWAARRGLKLDGDFVECGTYKGNSARIICDYLDFGATGRKFYLYDLFEHNDEMSHHSMPDHGEGLYGWVADRFADLDGVIVTKGSVPQTLSEAEPQEIAFLHIDMNDAGAEIGALKMLFDRVAFGAFVVLDDYGWRGYRTQKDLEDAFFAERGYQVLELPTGQGLVIK